jgi:hypothetical protein
MCLCSCFSYPPCTAHLFCAALYCYMWPVWLHHIFTNYLINGEIFGNILLNTNCVFWFSLQLLSVTFVILKADSHRACRAHAVSLQWLAAKGLECVFPIWFTQCGRVWFTLAMPRPRHALTMPFFSRPRHSTAVERLPVGYLPAFGFFRLQHGVPRRLLSEAY